MEPDVRTCVWAAVLAMLSFAGTPAHAAPLVMVAGADTVTLDSDRVVGPAPRTMNIGQLSGRWSARTVRLVDGDSVRIDDRTPAGQYQTDEGAFIELHEHIGGFPRMISAGTVTRWIDFTTAARDSTTRFGYLVTGEGEPGTREEFLRQMRVASGDLPIGEADTSRAGELVLGGLGRGSIELDRLRRTPLRVTWFAWEYALVFGPRRSGVRREGSRVTWDASRAGLAEPWPTAIRIPIEDAGRRLRVVGAVILDPRDGSILRVTD